MNIDEMMGSIRAQLDAAKEVGLLDGMVPTIIFLPVVPGEENSIDEFGNVTVRPPVARMNALAMGIGA